jgi:hypothetical protein
MPCVRSGSAFAYSMPTGPTGQARRHEVFPELSPGVSREQEQRASSDEQGLLLPDWRRGFEDLRAILEAGRRGAGAAS